MLKTGTKKVKSIKIKKIIMTITIIMMVVTRIKIGNCVKR